MRLSPTRGQNGLAIFVSWTSLARLTCTRLNILSILACPEMSGRQLKRLLSKALSSRPDTLQATNKRRHGNLMRVR